MQKTLTKKEITILNKQVKLISDKLLLYAIEIIIKELKRRIK